MTNVLAYTHVPTRAHRPDDVIFFGFEALTAICLPACGGKAASTLALEVGGGVCSHVHVHVCVCVCVVCVYMAVRACGMHART